MQGPRRRLRQLSQLSGADWKVLLAALFLLPACALSLRLKGFNWTRQFIEKHPKESMNAPGAHENHLNQAKRTAYLVSVAASHGIYRANCLKKALVAQWLLRRRGIDTDLKIGVEKDLTLFNAHAWLEYRDQMLVDSEETRNRFTAFDSH